MEKNEIILFQKMMPVLDETKDGKTVFSVRYDYIDPGHYTFDSALSEDIYMHSSESDRESSQTEFIDAEFAPDLDEDIKPYLIIAAMSGALSGTLSLKEIDADFLSNIGDGSRDSKWKDYIIKAANISGYKKSNYKEAVAFLLKCAVSLTDDLFHDQKERLKLFVRDLATNPSLAGFLFSLLSQFTGYKYSFDEENNVHKEPVPPYYAMGENDAEKIVYGVLYWLFYLVIDELITKRNILDNIKLPKELISVLKELLSKDFIRNTPTDIESAEKLFSNWIGKIFSGEKVDEDGNTFNMEMVVEEQLNQAFPVLLNECLTRAAYSVYKVGMIIKNNSITSFDQLKNIDLREIIPFDNKIVLHMIVVSNAAFVGVNVTGAIGKALYKKMVGDRSFSCVLLSEISIAGIGKLIFAVAADYKYLTNDFGVILEKVFRSKKKDCDLYDEFEENVDESYFSDDVFDSLSLDAMQSRILYSFENLAVLNDIANTKKKDEIEKK